MTNSTITTDLPRTARASSAALQRPLPVLFSSGIDPHKTVAHLMNKDQPGLTTYRSMGYVMEDGGYRCVGANHYGSNGFGDNAYASWIPSALYSGYGEKDIDQYDDFIVSATHAYAQTYLLTKQGKLYGWGYNGHGQVGDNSTTNRNYPVALACQDGFGTSPVIKVVTSDNGGSNVYTCLAALCADGSVWAWGYNGYGQLGSGATTPCMRPTRMRTSSTSFITDVIDIEAHGGHFGAVYCVKRDGTAWSCGYNGYGQLGVGDTTNRSYLTRCLLPESQQWAVVKGTGSADDKSGNLGVTLFLSKSGLLYGCGYNGYGQIGNGNATNCAIPQKVLSLGGANEPKVTHMWAFGGQYASCYASDDKGDFWAWGYNGYGQLGINSTSVSNPTRIPSSFMGRSDEGDRQAPFIVSMGYGGSGSYGAVAALSHDGRSWTTGYNAHGQTGHGHVTNQHYWRRPSLPPNTKVKEVQGFGHGNEIGLCFLTYEGRVYACGYNGEGGLGINAANTATAIPQRVIF